MDTQFIGSNAFGNFAVHSREPLMAMIEVTNRCNMDCPVCFSDANHPGRDVPLAEVEQRLKRLLGATGAPIPIQISGGKPTLRKDLPDIVRLARELGYRNIELITDGIKIVRDPMLLAKLKSNGLTAVYLQFDGLRKETYTAIRGRDMTEIRRSAIKAARAASLCCTLALVITRGVNDREVREIVRFAIDNIDTVRAINFQSATRFAAGRFELPPQRRGYSLPELLELIETEAEIPSNSFLSEHLGHPLCNAMSYVFVVNGRLRPLFTPENRNDVFAFMGERRWEKILGLFSGERRFFLKHLLYNPDGLRLAAKVASGFAGGPLGILRTKHLLVFAKSFMERGSLDPQRVDQCCYAISDPDGVYSFCAFNNLYRPHRRSSQ
jgi:uncharacterized radical SAM superfamily Fe-S cluster-containing enzyme